MHWEVTLSNGMVMRQGDLPYAEVVKYHGSMLSCSLWDDEMLIVSLELGPTRRMFFRCRNYLDATSGDIKHREWLIGWQESRPTGLAHTICTAHDDYAVSVTSEFTEANVIVPMDAELEAGLLDPRGTI